MSNQLLSRSCYLLGMFFGLVWGFADSLHTLRHPEGRSTFFLIQSLFLLISCTFAVLLLILLACLGYLQ
jgi:hypothetical protein